MAPIFGHTINFVQDNESMSIYGVMRGLHFQRPPFTQSKLARCVKGAVLDEAVDIRKGSPTYAWDLATAIVAALNNPVEGIYHYSNEGVCSWCDFTKMIQQIAVELEIPETYGTHGACEVLSCHSDEFSSSVKRPAYSVLDKTKVKETFGISIPYWIDSLKICIKNLMKA